MIFASLFPVCHQPASREVEEGRLCRTSTPVAGGARLSRPRSSRGFGLLALFHNEI
jgi:hypothetical protein